MAFDSGYPLLSYIQASAALTQCFASTAQAALHRGAGHLDLLFTSLVFSCWAAYWFWRQLRGLGGARIPAMRMAEAPVNDCPPARSNLSLLWMAALIEPVNQSYRCNQFSLYGGGS